MTSYEIMQQCTKLGKEDKSLSFETIMGVKFLIRCLDLEEIGTEFQSVTSQQGINTIFLMVKINGKDICYEISNYCNVAVLEGVEVV